MKLRLSAEDVKDIVQGVYAHVLDLTTRRFSPGKCSARKFLAGLAWNEAKALKLLARQRWDGRDQPGAGRVQRRLVPDGAISVPNPREENNETDSVLELVPATPNDPLQPIATGQLFEMLLRGEAPVTRTLVRSHFLNDEDIQDTARACRVSRFRASRTLRSFYSQARQEPGLLAALRTAV